MYELFITIFGTDTDRIGQSYPHETRQLAYADFGRRFAETMLKATQNENLSVTLFDTNDGARFEATLSSGEYSLTIRYEVLAI